MTTEWGALTGLFPIDSVLHGWLRARATLAAMGEGEAKDQRHDQQAAERDLDHGCATCTKVENPSDIMPVRMKAMPSPCSPSGRSA